MPAAGGDVTFGPFRLVLRERVLLRDDLPVPLGGRAFDLLATLAANSGDLVTKQAILDHVWPGQVVEESNLQVQVAALRKVLGHDWIATVAGRGYRLAAQTSAGAPLPPTGRPTLVVLPFVNLSGDTAQDYLADGLTEEVTRALSRARWYLVIARSSAFAYKGRQGIDIREVGRALGASYVLEGSVRRSGSRIRLSGSLIDAESGLHVWTDRFDGNVDDIFQLQDSLAAAVTGAIEPSLRDAEIARAYARPTANLDAYDLYLRAQPQTWAGSRDSFARSVDYLQRAIAADPGFVLAKAFLAFTLMNRAGLGWGDAEGWALGSRLAAEALAEDRGDSEVLRNGGHALAFFTHDHDSALAALERALALNPYSVRTLWSAGWVHDYRAEAAPAIALFERALLLSPLDAELGYMLSGFGLAHLIAGDSMQALPLLQRCIQEMPAWTPGLQFLVVALHWLGRTAEAREEAARLRALVPRLRIRPQSWSFRPGRFRDDFLAALGDAGIPK